MAETTRRRDLRVHVLGAVKHRFIECFDVITANSFKPGICHHRSGVVPNHDAAVAGAGPLGQKTTLLVGIDQSLLNLSVHRGVDQIEQGEERTEGIPEAGIGIHVAGEHLSVVGAVMNDIAIGIHLVKLPGEEGRAIEGGVEGALLIKVATLHLNPAEHLVPVAATLLFHLFKRFAGDLFQVLPRLFIADE